MVGAVDDLLGSLKVMQGVPGSGGWLRLGGWSRRSVQEPRSAAWMFGVIVVSGMARVFPAGRRCP